MKKLLLITLMLLPLFLTACNSQEPTAAETYLANHSEQELVDYFSEVSLFYYDFNNSQDIPEDNLYTFAMFHEKDSWFNETEWTFYIPIADIYEILNDYLDDYNLPAEWFAETFGENYDNVEQIINAGAIGMGTGCTAHAFVSAEAIDDDNIKVTLLQYCEDPEMQNNNSNLYITAHIVDGQAKFTSCLTLSN